MPHIVVARRREFDFQVVQVSAGFPLSDRVREEARWLALDWWGNCFLRSFDGAVGHFRSTVEEDLFYLMLVLNGPVAPDRFVVFLRREEYRPLAFNPFDALQSGLFDFAGDFYSARGEKWARPAWGTGVGLSLREGGGRFESAERHLASGGSILVPCGRDIQDLRTEIMMCLRELTLETRMRINLCSFTNAARDQLDHFGPILCGWYTTVWHRSLREVLEDLPGQEGSNEVR